MVKVPAEGTTNEDTWQPELVSQETECAQCRLRREKYQGLGMMCFFTSMFTCGLGTPFTLPLTAIFTILSARKCKDCRLKQKQEKTSSDALQAE